MGQAFLTRRGSNKNETYTITFNTTMADYDNRQPYSNDDDKAVIKKIDISAIKNKFNYIYIGGGCNGGTTPHNGMFSISRNIFLYSYDGLGDDMFRNTQQIFSWNSSWLGFEIIDDYLILFVYQPYTSSIITNHLFILEFS